MPFLDLVDGVAVPIIDRVPLLAASIPSTQWHARQCILQIGKDDLATAAIIYIGKQGPNGAGSSVSSSVHDGYLSKDMVVYTLGFGSTNNDLDLSVNYLVAVGANVRVEFNAEVC